MKNAPSDIAEQPKLAETARAQLEASFRRLLAEYESPSPSARAEAVDLLFAYRILLGRLPSPSHGGELGRLLQFDGTWRDFLNGLTSSAEFRGVWGFLPGGHALMSDANGFRFWFRTSDREMGAAMASGAYERSTVALARRIVSRGDVCLDIGAQTGFFTCVLADLVGPGGKVHAFEPRPSSIELLRRNVEENGWSARVTIDGRAVSSEAGRLDFGEVSGMYVVSESSEANRHQVEVVAIDDVIDVPVAFCKIDVEGHEPRVLRGMERTIDRCSPVILTEFNQYWLTREGSSASDYARRLRELGYELFTIDDVVLPLGESFDLPLLGNINVLALNPRRHAAIKSAVSMQQAAMSP